MSKKRKTSRTSEVVFEYTGMEEKDDIPKDVTIVRFHSSVTEIGDDYTFGECEQLKEVVLNEGLQKIGEGAFYYSKLEHINLPSTLLEIGERAFCNCNLLKKVVFNEGLRKVGIRSFYGCQNLELINLPSTFIEVGEDAFCTCSRLRGVVLNEGLTKIGKAAFVSCTSLESITIPSTVTDIASGTFADCRRLREVGLHEGIQSISIHQRAFDGCSSLERFTFPYLSTRLNTITRAGQTEAENKISIIRGLFIERRGSELFIPAGEEIIFRGANWEIIKDRLRGSLGRIDRLLTYYELKEATTLLELAMWKSKIEQAEVKPINRDVYRIDIPGPVKNTILQYLDFRV